MRTKPILFFLSGLYFLLSCSNGKTEIQQKTISLGSLISKENDLLDVVQERSTFKYDYSYFFSNDTICQAIYIRLLTKNDNDIPEKLEFNLVLKNKLKNTNVKIKGIAYLTSPNESFLDESDTNSGAYFAADYNKNNSGYTINFTLDIERYEACAVSIESDLNNNLENYLNYLKKFPNYNVLKRGDCR